MSDLERSLRFYCDALGFEKAESHAIGSEFARLMDLPDVAVTSQFIRRGPTAIELLAFSEPAPFGDARTPGRQPARADPPLVPGRTTWRRWRPGSSSSAGAVVESSRTTIDFGGTPLEFVYCTDPDGVRVELMDLGG